MLFGMGPVELIIILVIVLLIFGPKNLPKLGKTLGKTVKGVREGMDEIEGETKKDEAETSEASDVEVKHADEDADVEDADSGAKFCPDCGTKNPAENHFCSKCGHKLD